MQRDAGVPEARAEGSAGSPGPKYNLKLGAKLVRLVGYSRLDSRTENGVQQNGWERQYKSQASLYLSAG